MITDCPKLQPNLTHRGARRALGICAGLLFGLSAAPAAADTRSNTQEALPDKVFFADVDGNGTQDFVEVNGGKVVIRDSNWEGLAMTDNVLDLTVRIRKVFAGSFTGGAKDQICATFEDNSLRCYAISADGKSMSHWFTHSTSFLASNEEAMVGDFNGDARDDVMAYNPSTGSLRLYALRSTGAMFDPLPFTLGNLIDLDLRNKQIRVGEFGQSSARSDIIVIDPATRAIRRYDTAINAAGSLTFWWAFTATNHYSAAEDVTVANIAGQTTDDLVFRNRTTGAYRFTKASITNQALTPITTVSVGQLPTTAGGRVYWARGSYRPEEPGGTVRDTAYYISNGWLVRTSARHDGTKHTYWWYYSKGAPKHTRSQRLVTNLTATERAQFSALMRDFITEDVVNIHTQGHDWHSSTESFFYRHRNYLTDAEKYLLSRGGSLFVPMPMWDPSTVIPTELRWVKANANGTARPPLTNFDPGRAIPDGLKGSNVCSYATGDALSGATNGWHGGVHVAVGGTMANAGTSPAAVIFFPWHAYVDNIYARWHDCR